MKFQRNVFVEFLKTSESLVGGQYEFLDILENFLACSQFINKETAFFRGI